MTSNIRKALKVFADLGVGSGPDHETETYQIERGAIRKARAVLVSELAAPAIKRLVWRDHRPDSFPEPAWSAQTPFGFYNIEEVSASDGPAYVVRLHAHHFIGDKDSLEESKAAAQADYEERIRSCLVPSAAPDRDLISDETREGVERIREILNLGIKIQAVGGVTDQVVSSMFKVLFTHIDELEADLKCAIAVGRLAARSSQRAEGGERILVPLLPTKEMLEAGVDNNPTSWNDGTDPQFMIDVANDVYCAMIRASQNYAERDPSVMAD